MSTTHEKKASAENVTRVALLVRNLLEDVRRTRQQADRLIKRLESKNRPGDDAEDGWRLAA